PYENTERYIVFLAPCRQVRLGAAINMHLPDHVSERLVIISALCGRPRKAIAPMDVSSLPGVKRAMAIVDGDLRYRSKQEITHGLEFGQCRNCDRYDARAQDLGDSALSRRECEDTIGGLDQAPGEGDAFGLIGVEQRIGCVAPEYGFEFPGKIDGVADPG